jgi:TonB family protein
MRDKAALRILASLGVAFVIVSAMLWVGVELSGYGPRSAPRDLAVYAVSPISDGERRAVRGLLGEDRYGLVPVAAPDVPVESLDLSRPLRGVVRLDVLVDANGKVEDVRVIDASPAGIYEAQAAAEVRARRYTPATADGVTVPSHQLEIVNFTLTPAAETRAPDPEPDR